MPITQFCDDNKLTTGDRLKLFRDVCNAIQHAHQKGIIHRDIKPSNVMVTLHDGKPIPKVIDFGVSKAISQQLTAKTLFTAYGQMVGTPQYMSPEQAEMSGLDIDTRSDIYSLGVLLYELLTGTTPLDPARLRQTAYAEVQNMIRNDEPPTPSRRLSSLGLQSAKIAENRRVDAATLCNAVRGELDWIVMKAIEKERIRRYDTANGLSLDIARHLQNEPVSACPPSPTYLLRKTISRYKQPILICLSLFLLLVLGLIGTGVSLLHMRRALRGEKAALATVASERDRARELQGAAEIAQKTSEKLATQSREEQYISDMNLANQAWEQNDVFQLKTILERYAGEDCEDLRDFAWDWLSQACARDDSMVANFMEMSYGVQQTRFSADGKTLAVSLQDNTVEVWTSDHLGEYALSKVFGKRYKNLWFYCRALISPDGRTLIRPSDDHNDLSVESLVSGESRLLKGFDESVSSLEGSVDGELIAAAFGRRLRVWRSNDYHEVFSTELDKDKIRCIAFSPNSRWLVWGGGGGVLYGKDLSKGGHGIDLRRAGFQLSIDNGAYGKISSISFVPDDDSIMVGLEDGTVVHVGTDRFNEIRRLRAHSDGVRGMCFSPDSKILATCSRDNSIKLWQWPECHEIGRFRGHGGSVNSVVFHPQTGDLVSGSLDGTIRFWKTKGLQKDTIETPDRILFIGPSDSDEGFFIGTESRLQYWDVDKDQLKSLDASACDSIVVNPDGSFVRGLIQGEVKSRGFVNNEFTTSDGNIPLAFFPKKALVVVGRAGGIPQLWDLKTGHNIHNFETTLLNAHYARTASAFSIDGQLVAFPDTHYGVELFDVSSGKRITRLDGHKQGVVSIAFSPSHPNVAATCSWDNTVRLWDFKSNTEIAKMRHAQWIACVAFSPDGKLLASIGGDQKLRLWRVPSGRQILSIHTSFSHPRYVTFSKTGRNIAVTQEDGGSGVRTARVRIYRGIPTNGR